MELKRLLVNITLYNLPRKPKNSGDVSDDSKNSNKYLKRNKSEIGTHYQKEEEHYVVVPLIADPFQCKLTTRQNQAI